MLDFEYHRDKMTDEEWLETPLAGKALQFSPQLNKGTAFTEQERNDFNLLGKLPYRIETIEEQVERVYFQYSQFKDNFNKNIYLRGLHDRNQTLFYRLVYEHLEEMMPVIYTPVVGVEAKSFSREYRQSRGLFISYPERKYMRDILQNRTNPDIQLIVMSDGEGVLGIGDQGIGGMGIPIAKLMVYTLCGCISPLNTLPILLDVGTNNKTLLEDPMYLGWRHERISQKEYDEFIEQFIETVIELFPNVFLHWEDFGRGNANRYLKRFRHRLCTFNDDLQGTGVVTMAALLAAVNAKGEKLTEQRFVIFGAGTAGVGIADQIVDALKRHGMSAEEAYDLFWLVDRDGLITSASQQVTEAQEPYRRKEDVTAKSLLDVVKLSKATVLVGASAQTGSFNQEIIELMCQHTSHPIIFPLSNPTEKVEVEPKNALKWSNGRAFIATGSPFEPVEFEGESYRIAQCNNAFAFPGIGLGIIASQATSLTDNMMWQACCALSECSPLKKNPKEALLPTLNESRKVARHVARAVMQAAIEDQVTDIKTDDIDRLIQKNTWRPHYIPYKRAK